MGALDVTKALNCEFNEEVRVRNEINFLIPMNHKTLNEYLSSISIIFFEDA